ncbi:MAG: pirin family protein [Thiohalomonadaceae bacterium]
MAEHPLHYRAVDMDEGAGAHVKRLFPVAGLRHVDPFVLLDEFFVGPEGGFPEHPHRGFEAVTYLMSGAMRHRDNLGNDSIVQAGGAQVFTAGRGIVHAEAPAGEETAHGIQLWINMAKIHKDLPPAYQAIAAEQLPLQELSCGRVRTVIGPGSPIHLHSAVSYHDVQLDQEGEFHLAVPAHHAGLLYAVAGEPEVADECLEAGTALLLAGASVITVYASAPCRFICVSGQPHGEPIVQNGPYVD